jgi:hypothetical protein
MRQTKLVGLVIATTVVVGLAAMLFLSWRYNSLYKWFQAHDQTYFMHVAQDSDSVLKRHGVGFAGLQADSRALGWFRLPESDATLPASIQVLHPDYILVSTNRLWVNCGGRGRLDWGFMWGQDSEPRTNTWVLRSCIAYGFERTLYAESKP